MDDTLSGGEGNGRLSGDAGNDSIAGDDQITGTGLFEGGSGDDSLTAGDYGSADTHLFRLGDGKDTINNTSDGDRIDTLRFAAASTGGGEY